MAGRHIAHRAYDPAEVAHLLPVGLKIETYDGTAWVGLIAFHMNDVRAPGMPAVPWLSNFPETNVRTYARSPQGRPESGSSPSTRHGWPLSRPDEPPVDCALLLVAAIVAVTSRRGVDGARSGTIAAWQ